MNTLNIYRRRPCVSADRLTQKSLTMFIIFGDGLP